MELLGGLKRHGWNAQREVRIADKPEGLLWDSNDEPITRSGLKRGLN